MKEFGELLKEARENKGLTLQELSRLTKIRTVYLEAIEEGELEKLPGKVYTKGFLKAYASAVGLDPTEIIAKYDSQIKKLLIEDATPVSEIKPIKSGSPKFLGKLIIIVLVLGLIGVGIFFLSDIWSTIKNETIPELREENPSTSISDTTNSTQPASEPGLDTSSSDPVDEQDNESDPLDTIVADNNQSSDNDQSSGENNPLDLADSGTNGVLDSSEDISDSTDLTEPSDRESATDQDLNSPVTSSDENESSDPVEENMDVASEIDTDLGVNQGEDDPSADSSTNQSEEDSSIEQNEEVIAVTAPVTPEEDLSEPTEPLTSDLDTEEMDRNISNEVAIDVEEVSDLSDQEPTSENSDVASLDETYVWEDTYTEERPPLTSNNEEVDETDDTGTIPVETTTPSTSQIYIQLVADGTSRVKVLDQGDVIFDEVLQPGDLETLSGNRLKVQIDNAAAIQINYNGLILGPYGETNEAVEKIFE